MNQEIQKTALDRLTPEERKAYDDYVASGRPSLSVDTSLKLFELYCHGSSCEEIAKLNPNLGLGMILKARVDYLWDAKRDAYTAVVE